MLMNFVAGTKFNATVQLCTCRMSSIRIFVVTSLPLSAEYIMVSFETSEKLKFWLTDLQEALKEEHGANWNKPGEFGQVVDSVLTKGVNVDVTFH